MTVLERMLRLSKYGAVRHYGGEVKAVPYGNLWISPMLHVELVREMVHTIASKSYEKVRELGTSDVKATWKERANSIDIMYLRWKKGASLDKVLEVIEGVEDVAATKGFDSVTFETTRKSLALQRRGYEIRGVCETEFNVFYDYVKHIK